MAPTVRLIVLNFNGGAFLGDCLAALHRLDWPGDDLEIVVVDNASTDGSADDAAARFPGVRLIRNPRNEGFPANNLGLADLTGIRYVGLVNNDGFVEPGWLRALVTALEDDPALGAAAAKMVFAPTFLDVDIDSPTFTPGPGDSRSLGVQLRGVRIAGVDRTADAQVGLGGWGGEHDRDGRFEWTDGHAVLRVPVDPDVPDAPDASTAPGDPDARKGRTTVEVDIALQAPTPTKVTLTSGGEGRTVEVGPALRWVTVAAAGTPYDVVQNAGSMVFADGAGADRGFGTVDDGRFDGVLGTDGQPCGDEVFAWCGGSVLFRRAYVEETGAFDERFFLYYEDTDWSWRGRAQGWRYRYVPGAVMRHKHAATSGEGSPVFAFHVERNRLLMLVKNAPWRLAGREVVRFGLITASYARRDIVGPLRRGHRPNPTVVLRRAGSFLGFVRLLPAMLASRRGLRRRQIVPDAELTAWLVPRDAG